MTLFRHCQQALSNLGAAKLRSFLALLGILVGTAAVVALLSCGRLATEEALAQFKALGTDLLSISVFQKEQVQSEQIPLEFWRQLPNHIPYVLDIAPYALAYQAMSFRGHMLQGTIIGADESLARIIHTNLAKGHFVSFVNTFERFCVIGAGIAEQLRQISFDSPIGKQLLLGQTLYTIIGELKPWKENSFFTDDMNQSVIIPIIGMSLVNKDSKINNTIMVLKPDSPIDTVIEQITQLINRTSPKLTVYSRSAKQIIAGMESQGRIFTWLLAIIGGISLLVGGIGVMNVMLVSVSERKKEIGIRKAVGAKNSEIQVLFLIESIMLSLVGGALGVCLGLMITWIIAYFSNWTFTIYNLPPLAGFAVSFATGIFFGFYPARRAAKMEAIVSLRND